MVSPDFARVIEQYHRTVEANLAGDPEPQKRLWSRRDDVTLANPFGPPARGWDQVEAALDRAAALLLGRAGEIAGVERVSAYATAELAYTVEIEQARLQLGGADELAPISLRVTTIFRREDGEWLLVHRHADTVTGPRPLESLREP